MHSYKYQDKYFLLADFVESSQMHLVLKRFLLANTSGLGIEFDLVMFQQLIRVKLSERGNISIANLVPD